MVTVCPSQFATRRTLFHVLVGCGLLMLKVSRLKLPVIWLLVDRKSGSAGMPRPISYAVFCLKKKKMMIKIGHLTRRLTRDDRFKHDRDAGTRSVGIELRSKVHRNPLA